MVLPVDAVLPALLTAVQQTRRFVLVAPPGAGKTTRVPPALLDAVQGNIVVVQPRRVAARAAARRMAAERGEPVGKTVGFHVRFDRQGGDHTRIWVVSDGMLLRWLDEDPLLSRVGAVLLDEVHERRIETDLLLAFLAEVCEAREDLVVGAMSATVDADPIAAYLSAPILRSEGRTFPLTVEHLPYPDDRPLEHKVADGVRRMLAVTEGDLLAFLPGVGAIERTRLRLADLGNVDVVPLYGDLAADAQDSALVIGPRRRVVLATNVAETSVTVPGVRAVVDSGLVRRPRLDPATGLDHLDEVPISRACADQRAGRAGRTGPGAVLRLWTARDHEGRDAFDAPEVQRIDLCGPVLAVLAWGANPRAFRWFEPPPEGAVDAALAVLADLGACDARGAVTPLGREIAGLPLHPRLARLFLAGARSGHAEAAARMAVLLSERPRFADGPPLSPSSSDVLERLDAFPHRGPLTRQVQTLVRAAPRVPAERTAEVSLRQAVFAAWPDRVVRRRTEGSDRGRMVGGKGVRLDRGSAVTEAPLFVAVSLVAEVPDARVRLASAVDRDWLVTEDHVVTTFDPDAEAVRSRREVRYRDVVLESHPIATDPAQAAEVLALAAAADLSRVQPDDASFARLTARLARAASWEATGGWEVDWNAVLVMLCHGLSRFTELRAADWPQAVRNHLGHRAMATLDQLVPDTLTVPSGRAVPLDYTGDGPPVLAVRMQDLFGQRATPTVGKGKIKVLLHLLAPNGRPQQVTDDLAGFWERTWPEVRKELRARYPRHSWPEDPTTASPERRPKPRPR